MLSSLVVALVGLVLTWRLAAGLEGRARQLVFAAYFAHLVAAVAQVYVTQSFYGAGDSTAYYASGRYYSRLLEIAPDRFLPDLLRMLAKGSVVIPYGQFSGTSTGVMQAFSGLLVYVLGESFLACNMACAVIASLGLTLLFRGLKSRLGDELTSWGGGMLLLPSVVFWSSGLLKEAIAVAGLGCAVYGYCSAANGRRAKAMVWFLVGAWVMYLVKPYILAACIVGGCVWIVSTRFSDLSPARLALLGVAGGLGVLLVGELLPQLNVSTIGDELMRRQAIGIRAGGGSVYEMLAEDGSLASQLLLAPLAIATSLFRPLPTDVHNVVSAMNAVETTVLLIAFARLISRGALTHVLLGRPERAFATVFVLVTALGVGLATTNLGTLSRYRIPLMPLFVMLLATRVSERVDVVEPSKVHLG